MGAAGLACYIGSIRREMIGISTAFDYLLQPSYVFWTIAGYDVYFWSLAALFRPS